MSRHAYDPVNNTTSLVHPIGEKRYINGVAHQPCYKVWGYERRGISMKSCTRRTHCDQIQSDVLDDPQQQSHRTTDRRGTLTKFSQSMPKAEVETPPTKFSPRKLIDRKTASVLLLFTLQVGIGIIMLSYRSCGNNNVTHGQANLQLAREAIGNNNSRDNNEVKEDTIFVHVIGQVRVPGVYRLPQGSKAYDAIAMAGGSLPTAKLDSVNLTRRLVDEEQIIVPH